MYMKKIVVCLFAVLLLTGCGKQELLKEETDAIKFKNEYESINNVLNEDGSNRYLKLEISEENPMKYVTPKEAIELLESKTGVLYIGFKECPWCRNAINPLIDAALEQGIDTIYYLDPKEIRDDALSGKPGTAEYEKLLEMLDEYLNEYMYTNESGETVSANKKRLYVPDVFFVENGKIIGHHFKTVDSQKESAKIPLTSNEREELKQIYIDLMSKFSTTCESAC